MATTKYSSHHTVAVVDPNSSTTDPNVLKPNADGSINVNSTPVAGQTQDVNLLQTGGVAVAKGAGTAATALRVELPTDGTGKVGLNTFQKATYSVSAAGYTAYATPQDLLTVENPAGSGKVVYVTRLTLFVQSTAAALQTVNFIKRSALSTGGAHTSPALVPYDSANAAAVSVLRLYTSAPTPGASVGTLRVQEQASSTLAVTPPMIDLYTAAALGSAVDLKQAVTLRPGELLATNYGGAALTVGFTAAYLVEVVEV